MFVLQTFDLKKYYGEGPNLTRALDGVDFSVEDGEFVAVVGTSGSGKSTLLHMMGGLDTPTSGRVFVCNRDLSELNDEQLTIFRRRNIGFVFQNYNLVPILNVYENIVLPVELDGGTADRRFLDSVIQMLGLDDKLDNMPNQLSGGEQQRIALARAILKDAPIILLDEATASLDVENETKVQQALSRLLAGKTVLVIAHRMRTVEAADKIVVLHGGRVVEEGTPARLMAKGGLYRRMVDLQRQSAGWQLGKKGQA